MAKQRRKFQINIPTGEDSKTVQSKLYKHLSKNKLLSRAKLTVDPTNSDLSVPRKVSGIIAAISHLTRELVLTVSEVKHARLFVEAMEKISDTIIKSKKAVNGMTATDPESLENLDTVPMTVRDNPQPNVTLGFPKEEVDNMPGEVLHTLAHQISGITGIPFDCNEFGKEELIVWIKENGVFQENQKDLN